MSVHVQKPEQKELAGCPQSEVKCLCTQKNIIEPWPAPRTNSNDYCCFNYDHKSLAETVFKQIVMITVVLTMTTKVWQKLFSNNSNPSYLNTATPKDLEGKLQTYLKCWFHRPTDTESVSLMMPFHIY